MAVMFKDNPTKKIEYVLSLAASGKTNKEIAEELGYKDVQNLYVFMRRHGMVWNSKKALFLVKGEKQEEQQEILSENPTGKVARIMSMFSKNMDGKEIANSLRFSSYQEMADYMRSKGYLWDNAKQNYLKTVEKVEKELREMQQEQIKMPPITINQQNNIEQYSDILKLLAENKNKLLEIFKPSEKEQQSIPRYSLPGDSMIKSVNFTNTINRLVKEFSEDKNITQKVIFEVAVIEFLKKYGYASQVKTVLHI
jgi:hypothetical protein